MAINITSKSAQVNNLYNILNQPNLDIQVAQLQNLINDILTLTQLTLQRNDAGALLSRNVTNDAAADFIAAAITGTTITGSSFIGDVTGIVTGASSVTKASPASGGYGLYTRKYASATVTCAASATATILTSVPAGVILLGALIRVDTAITGAGSTFQAAYSGGSTEAIDISIPVAKNSKTGLVFNPSSSSPITTTTTNILLTPSSGTLTGVVTGVIFYEELTNLTSI